MKIFYKNFSLVLLFVFVAGAFFSFDVRAQRTKPPVSKKAQMNRLANQAIKEMEGGRTETAVEIFSKCIALKPVEINAFKCFMGRGTAYLVLKKYEEAIADFNVAYDTNLDRSVVYFRGRAYFELKKYEQANKDFLLATIFIDEARIKKEFADLYNYHAASYTARGKYDEAINAYKKALELNARSGDSYFGRGIAYELKGDFDNAEKDLRKALELDPGSKALVEEAFKRIEERKSAKESDLKAAVKPEKTSENFSTDTDDISALTVFADRYFNISEYEKAAETYSKIIRLDPKNAEAVYRRGTSYGNQDKTEPAIADYTKAIELDPEYARAYLSRGATFQDIGKYEDAIRDLSKAIELDPENDFGYIFRAKAYCKTGKTEAAKADEEKAKKLGGFITEPCL